MTTPMQTRPRGWLPDGRTGNTIAAADVKPDAADTDALARIKDVLGQYGLETLSTWVWDQIIGGKSEAEILQDLREHPTFKAEFPEIEQRQKGKLAPLSPGEIVAYRASARRMMRAAGLPEGFYDSKDDFTKLLTSDVSLDELDERIGKAREATYGIPEQAKRRLAERFGVQPGSGLLTAFFLDPDRALPLIQRDVNAAKIGGRADMAGYALTNAQADLLADAGVSDAQAAQGFGELAQSSELFAGLDRTEDVIDTDAQLGAAFGNNAAAQQRIERRRAKRKAAFQGDGGFAEGQRGVAGLGSVNS